MPVFATPVDSDLVLVVQTGVDGSGNPVYRAQRYSNLKPSATNQDAYDVAVAVAGLQTYPLAGVRVEVIYNVVGA